MHLYLDTSALVKKYFWEIDSTDVTALWIQADSLSTSFVAYAETLAAFYRKHRETPIQKHIFQAILDTFHKDWDSFIRVEVNKELCQHIDRLLEHHPLRGFDVIHLASALLLRSSLPDKFLFVCFDPHLHKAAKTEGLEIFPATLG